MNDNYASSYNSAFIEAVHKQLFSQGTCKKTSLSKEISNKINSYSDTDFKELFWGNNKVWLSKELYKWKSKLFNQTYNFQGTINNLELFCKLTDKDPNSVLLSGSDFIRKFPRRITFLTKDTVYEIYNTLYNNPELFEEEFVIPVEYTPMVMLTLFLRLYHNENSDIMMEFYTSQFSEFENGLTTYPIDNTLINITSPKKGDTTTIEQSYSEAISVLNFETEENSMGRNIEDLGKQLQKIISNPQRKDLLFELYLPNEQILQDKNPSILETLEDREQNNIFQER